MSREFAIIVGAAMCMPALVFGCTCLVCMVKLTKMYVRRCMRSSKLTQGIRLFNLYHLFRVILLLPRCTECTRHLAMRILSVRPSLFQTINTVRPSVRQTRALWQNGRKICTDVYTIRKIIQRSFLRIVRGRRTSTWNLGVNWPTLERNRRFWTDIRS